MSLPAASQQQVDLLDLPLPALYAILHRAGPRCRELCRALLDLYGPLPRLTPRGVDTPESLLAALATKDGRHSHLSSLDLRHIPNVITDKTLLALCAALPNMRTLRLARPPSHRCTLTAASVAAAVAQLSRLTALQVPDLSRASPQRPLKGCPVLRVLGLPVLLPEPRSTAALPRFAGLSKVRFENVSGFVDMTDVAALVAQLPALVALELGGCNTFGPVCALRGLTKLQQDLTQLQGVTELQVLTRLSALTLEGEVVEHGAMAGQLLQLIGTLTNLRSLQLFLVWAELDTTAHHGWLSRLTLLTSLTVDLRVPGGEVIHDVLSSVAHMPALGVLSIADTRATPALSGLDGAAACSSLRCLSLNQLLLPPSMFTKVLPQLTGLTCLRFNVPITPTTPHVESFSWLSVLTALKELWYGGHCDDTSVLPCELLVGLPHVDTLYLGDCSFVDAPYLEQLCDSMPQLTSLDLSYNSNMGAGLSSLQLLTNLEVLGLGRVKCSTEVLQHLRALQAPPNLRRCHLGDDWEPEEQAAARVAARALLGRQVEAVFSDWAEEQHEGW